MNKKEVMKNDLLIILSEYSKELTIADKESIANIINNTCDKSTGRTTRLIDYYIQQLFQNKGEYVVICDHYDSVNSHRRLFDLIVNRLQTEHPGVAFEGVYEKQPKRNLSIRIL